MVERKKAEPSIGQRLHQLRESKGLSQGDIETKTGLLRCYISRVENGHTVPSLETLQRFAHGLDVSLYEIFYEEDPPPSRGASRAKSNREQQSATPEDKAFLGKLRELAPRLSPQDQEMLVALAKKLAGE